MSSTEVYNGRLFKNKDAKTGRSPYIILVKRAALSEERRNSAIADEWLATRDYLGRRITSNHFFFVTFGTKLNICQPGCVT
jgi:hypothetical protein